MSANVLADKDINTSALNTTKSTDDRSKDVKGMEHHRQVLQSRLAEDGYVFLKPYPTNSGTAILRMACMEPVLMLLYYV